MPYDDDDMEGLRPRTPKGKGMSTPPKMNALMMEIKSLNSPESKMQEAMTRKMNIGRVLHGPKGMIGPSGSAKPKMVMTQNEGMKTASSSFMEGQKKKAEEKEAGRKARLQNQPNDDATEYWKQQAREQRKKRGMD